MQIVQPDGKTIGGCLSLIPQPAKYAHDIPKYSGTENPAKYLLRFERACTVNRWPQQIWLPYLIVSLEGAAEHFYNSYAERRRLEAAARGIQLVDPTYQEFTTALQQAFSSFTNPNQLLHKVETRKQQVGETAEQYHFAMMGLLSDYNDRLSDAEKVRYIIKNLRPSYLKQINVQNPRTPDELLELIRKVDETTEMLLDREDIAILQELANNGQPNEATKEITNQLGAITLALETTLKNQMAQANQPAAQGTGPRRPLSCWICKGPHRASQCPNKTPGQQGNSNGNYGGRQQSNNGPPPEFFCVKHGPGNHSTRFCRALKAERDAHVRQLQQQAGNGTAGSSPAPLTTAAPQQATQ